MIIVSQRSASPRRWLRRLVLAALALALALVLAAATVGIAAWQSLAAREGEWALPLRFTLAGRTIERETSVATLLRIATHPLARPVLDGRRFANAQGHWSLEARADGSLAAHCAPCRLHLAALGPAPLQVEAGTLLLQAEGADRYHGSLVLGRRPDVVNIAWQGRFSRRVDEGFRVEARLAPAPIATAVRVFGADLPERERVRVQGRWAFSAAGRLPAGPWKIQPTIEGFAVEGLGTERLSMMARPTACRVDAQVEVPTLSGWLPRAVIAAEDARFYEHPGYDLTAMLDAWAGNQRPGTALAGASTITQQLAKLTVTGDERSASRKLRELLYAVEMEHTLGKARILQLYLALAPWGDGVCGAERAVRVHLGQRDASAVGPVAASWLASLLPAPDGLLRAELARGEIDIARVQHVIESIRPMRSDRREKALTQLLFWAPPAIERQRAAVAAVVEAPTARDDAAPAPPNEAPSEAAIPLAQAASSPAVASSP